MRSLLVLVLVFFVPSLAYGQDPPAEPSAAPPARPAGKKIMLKVGKSKRSAAPAGKRIRIKLGGAAPKAAGPPPGADGAKAAKGKPKAGAQTPRIKRRKLKAKGSSAKAPKQVATPAAGPVQARPAPQPSVVPKTVPPPTKSKRAKTKRKGLAKLSRRKNGKLLGTQATYGRKTAWGVVETYTPYEVAVRRGSTKGTEYRFPELVFFPEKTVRVTKDIDMVVRELARYLRESPEVKLILVEGHADDRGKPAYNQVLSEARASAVREALVMEGAPDSKVLAYGYGKTRPRSADASENRRVVLRLVVEDLSELEIEPATDTYTAGVTGIWGHGWSAKATGAAANAAGSGGDLFRWGDLELRDELPGGTDVRTNADSVIRIRFPDLGRVWLGPKTAIRLNQVQFNPETKRGIVSLELVKGTLRFSSNPLRHRDSRLEVRFPGASLDAYSGDFMLMTDQKGKGQVAVDRGSVQVDVGRQNTLPVAAGKALSLGAGSGKPVARNRIRAPLIIAPLRGAFLKPPSLEWEALSEASGYVIEISLDLDFNRPFVSELVAKPRYVPLSLPPGKTFYWRVHSLDQARMAGMKSQIHTFRLTVPPTSAALHAPPSPGGFGFTDVPDL